MSCSYNTHAPVAPSSKTNQSRLKTYYFEYVDGTRVSAGEAGRDSVLATKADTASGKGETPFRKDPLFYSSN
jgi:hypothetical protein